MNHFVLSVLTLVIQQSVSQIHIGPIGEPIFKHGVKCYNCNDEDLTFPSCLSTSVVCELDEVCRILYGDTGPRINCKGSKDCSSDISRPLRNCTGGGVEVEKGRCQKCCKDDVCIDNLAELLKTEFPESLNLGCPGSCYDDDIQACKDNATICLEGEFCQVQKKDHQIMGVCTDLHYYRNCMDHLEEDPCDAPPGQSTQSNCYWDCCSNNECLEAHFLIPLPSEFPTETTAPPIIVTDEIIG